MSPFPAPGQSLEQGRRVDSNAIDPSATSDISAVLESRRLGAADRRALVRVVAGAVRPNRDRPIWQLGHLISGIAAELAAKGGPVRLRTERCIALLLDPGLTSPRLLSAKLPNLFANRGGTGPTVFPGDAPLLLAFAEFLFTHEDCAFFSEMSRHVQSVCEADAEAARTAAVETVVAAIASHLRRWRANHMPVARYEKVFRAILTYLSRDRISGPAELRFNDEDILGFWEDETGGGNRMLFPTVVQHFRTFQRVVEEVRSMSQIETAASIDAAREDGAMGAVLDRLGTSVDYLQHDDRFEPLASFLEEGLPAEVKILTGAEQQRLAELVACGSFTEERPLTVLRSLSFGTSQSGISNFLRRGGGGASLPERLTCADAETYDAIGERYAHLSEHCDRLLKIIAYLSRLSAGNEASSVPEEVSREGQTALKALKRAGFDREHRQLAADIIPSGGAIAGLKSMVSEFLDRIAALEAAEPVSKRFEADRSRFARAFALAYGSASQQEGR